jgi:hypothetical protein
VGQARRVVAREPKIALATKCGDLKSKGPARGLYCAFQNLILTGCRVDVRANRGGGLSTPVRSYSNHGKAHGGVSQRLCRRLWVPRKHPLLPALAPLSRRRARLRQWR